MYRKKYMILQFNINFNEQGVISVKYAIKLDIKLTSKNSRYMSCYIFTKINEQPQNIIDFKLKTNSTYGS